MQKNDESLSGQAAVEKITEFVNHNRTVMMLTALETRPFSSRPMAVQKVDEQGSFIFFSRKDSNKNQELGFSDEMHIDLLNDSRSEYLSLYGNATIFRDQNLIDELYSIFANTWFEGKDDPNLTLIKFTPSNGHYWDSKHGKFVQLTGILLGAITGKQTDDGIQGDINL